MYRDFSSNRCKPLKRFGVPSAEASSTAQDENLRLKRRLAQLESDLTAPTDFLVQVEAQRDQSVLDLELRIKEGMNSRSNAEI
jgi:hypothetical protein